MIVHKCTNRQNIRHLILCYGLSCFDVLCGVEIKDEDKSSLLQRSLGGNVSSVHSLWRLVPVPSWY